MTTDYNEKIVSRVVDIMYKNPNIFPISKVFHEYAKLILKKPSTKDLEFYVRHSLESRIGLQAVVRHIGISVGNLWHGSNLGYLKYLEKTAIKSALLEYITPHNTLQDSANWKNLVKTEKLV